MQILPAFLSRPPRGGRGLKCHTHKSVDLILKSPSSRRAWIEMSTPKSKKPYLSMSPSSRRACTSNSAKLHLPHTSAKYGRVLQRVYNSFNKHSGYVFGQYNPKSGRIHVYGRTIQSSAENIRQESVGSGVSERTGEAGSINDLCKVKYRLRREGLNRLDVIPKNACLSARIFVCRTVRAQVRIRKRTGAQPVF